jgi:hypothetical protein
MTGSRICGVDTGATCSGNCTGGLFGLRGSMPQEPRLAEPANKKDAKANGSPFGRMQNGKEESPSFAQFNADKANEGDLSEAQKIYVKGVIQRVPGLAQGMIDSLTRWNSDDQTFFYNHFGRRDAAARLKILKMARAAKAVATELGADNFRNTRPTDFPRDPASVYAWVYPGDPTRTIYLGGLFFNQTLERAAGTVLHEISHFTDVGDTQDRFPDHNYGRVVNSPFLMKELRMQRPDLTIQHSYTVHYYALGLNK